MWLRILNNFAEAVGALIMILVLLKLDKFIERKNPLRWQQAPWHMLNVTVLAVLGALTGTWWVAFFGLGVFAMYGWMWLRRWQ